MNDEDGANSNPFDVVNAFIEVGKKLHVLHDPIDDEDLISEVHDRIPLDTLKTTHLSLSEYYKAIDEVKIQPDQYFKIGKISGKIGVHLTVLSKSSLLRAYDFYQNYRDPRVRDQRLNNAELLMDSIIRQLKLLSRNEPSEKIEIPISKVTVPSGMKLSSIYDIPTLEWKRSEEDSQLFYTSFLYTVVAILKKGWMMNPELIRLLTIIDTDTLDKYLRETTTFTKSRIVVSLQRLADIVFLTNFGIVDQTIHSHLIDDMFNKPIEQRGNLPQSEAKDVVKFLNEVGNRIPEFAELSRLSRHIGVLTKPVSDESPEFRGFDTAGDAIREILSVIHYSMNNHKLETQIKTIYDTITDSDFSTVMKYYFDPSYELLHTPFLTMIQSTKERMKVMIEKTYMPKEKYTTADIDKITEVQNEIDEYLLQRPSTEDLIGIWHKLNNFLEPQVDKSISSRSKKELFQLIKGKEIILNIMTPLLLAKHEGRGYNPLAAKMNQGLESRMKSITGVVAMGSNLSSHELKDLLDTMFIEAPEKPVNENQSNSPPSPRGIPMPKGKKVDPYEGSNLIPTKMGIGLARIANEYVTGGGERNLHRALVDLIAFTKQLEKA